MIIHSSTESKSVNVAWCSIQFTFSTSLFSYPFLKAGGGRVVRHFYMRNFWELTKN